MVRQLTLDGVNPVGISVFLDGSEPRVEASYQVLAGEEVVMTRSRDITPWLTQAQKDALVAYYGQVFAAVTQRELG